jgi:hypothetical protein
MLVGKIDITFPDGYGICRTAIWQNRPDLAKTSCLAEIGTAKSVSEHFTIGAAGQVAEYRCDMLAI